MAAKVYALFFFFFNDTATTEIYTLSLHDALPIWRRGGASRSWAEAATTRNRKGVKPHRKKGRMRVRAILAPVGGPGGAGLPRQARRLGADALDLVHGLRGARGEHLTAVGGDQHVVLDAH